MPLISQLVRTFAAEAIAKPKFTSKYLIDNVKSKLIPAVKEWEKSYQPPVIHLGRVLSVGDGIARIYGLKSVQVRHQPYPITTPDSPPASQQLPLLVCSRSRCLSEHGCAAPLRLSYVHACQGDGGGSCSESSLAYVTYVTSTDSSCSWHARRPVSWCASTAASRAWP